MKPFVAGRIVKLYTGTVQITREQARRRIHSRALRPLDPEYSAGRPNGFSMDDRYEVTGEVTFKAGEQFSYDGDIPGHYGGSTEPAGHDEAKRR